MEIDAQLSAAGWSVAAIDSVHADCACGVNNRCDTRRGIVDMVATGTDIKPFEKRRRPVGVLDAEEPEAITPRRTIESFEQFLEKHRDRLLALQILYNQSAGPGALTYEVIRELRDTLAQAPYHLAPEVVWQAYAALEKTTPRTPPAKVLTNLITLVRHTVDPEHQPLAPFPELVEARYQQWLDQQSNETGPGPFTDAQRHWLDIIKNYIALNGAFSTEDPEAYRDAWEGVDSRQANALAVAHKAFGDDLKPIIEELNTVLVA